MKSADLKVGVTYGVIPSWDYSSQEKKDPLRCTRRSVAKCELVSLEKYEYKVFRGDNPSDANFVIAPKGVRSVGYLVKSNDWSNIGNNSDVYWIARAQDVVAIYSDLETRWNVEEAREKELEAQRLKEREEQDRLEREAYAYAQRISDSCTLALQSVIGDRAKGIKAEVGRRRNSNGDYIPTAEFTIDAVTMQLLIEKILEARDAVA